ncbi:MAG: DNA repair and recombination protein RadA [Candidatus Hecatellaceae archaeon]
MKTKVKLEEVKGIGPQTAKRLRAAGFPNVETVAATPAKELMVKANYKELNPALRIVAAAREALGNAFISAWDHYKMTKNRSRCTTGSKALDRLLGGGVETGTITEFTGKYGSGKTQICHSLAVLAQLKPEEGGLGGGVLFFDTEGTFSSKRVYDIAEKRGLDPEATLHNIILSRVYTSDHQTFLLDHAFQLCPEQNIRLVIVDSAISHFRGEYVGRESLSERQQKLNFYLHKLLRLAEAYNLAAVITNQAIDRPVQTYAPQLYLGNPTGGNIIAHASNTRVWLRRGKGKVPSVRVARVLASVDLPEQECVFRISEKGIEDTEDYEPEKGEVESV